MKKLLAVFVSAAFFLVPLNAIAAVKAGASCSKLGATSTYAGKKYTCIKSGKKLVWNKGEAVAAPKPTAIATPKPSATPTPTQNSTPLPTSTPTPSPTVIYKQSDSIASVESCKLKDQRIKKTQPNNNGFPHSDDIIPNIGIAKFIFIPIEFPDAPGTTDFLTHMQGQMKKVQQWYTDYSGGKLKIEITTTNKWIRAPHEAAYYDTGKSCPNCANPFAEVWNSYAQEFINAGGNQFDYTGVHGVFFVFPKDAKTKISYELLGRGVELKTPQGNKNLFFWANGEYGYNLESKQKEPYSRFYSYWIHELLHSQGIPLHAPGNGFQTSLATDQSGDSAVLDAWETFLMGWLEDQQVYCAPLEKLTNSIVILEPIDVPGTGLRMASVPLNSHEALIVESRRPIGYSSGWDKEDSGIFVYLLDTTKDNDRSAESSGDSGNDLRYSKWAFYLLPEGRSEPILGTPQVMRSRYKNYLMGVGDKVKYQGVTITLLQSSDKDVVRIEK